jgi:hypothetical protein
VTALPEPAPVLPVPALPKAALLTAPVLPVPVRAVLLVRALVRATGGGK